MSAFVYPVFNFTLWQNPVPERTIRNLCELGILIILQAGLIGLVLTEWNVLLYPLALLSAVGVLTLLTCINSMIVLMLIRRENIVNSWRTSIIPLLAGLMLSIIQIGIIDLIRYALTGTLEGFPLS